ncbi:type II secretion system protein [Leptolyngbya sp. AN02str]|uniref:type II secretion system protein n=1 Tax=Leptolyngbya sp. AN02str TaxID=3423363 RepID=UPI003D312065
MTFFCSSRRLFPLLQAWLKAGRASTTSPTHSEAGVSLLESLVAIAVIGIVATLILPPLFVSTGTRSQNRRAEQALQIAQGEIDRIRVQVANGLHEQRYLPATVAAANFSRNVIPPTGPLANVLKSVTPSCNTYNPNTHTPSLRNNALAIDIDGDCQADFYMQVFRDAGVIPAQEINTVTDPTRRRPSTFRLGVRVWTRLVNGNWAAIPRPVDPASIQLTGGAGQQFTRPLAVINSRISWSDRDFSAEDLNNQIGASSGN